MSSKGGSQIVTHLIGILETIKSHLASLHFLHIAVIGRNVYKKDRKENNMYFVLAIDHPLSHSQSHIYLY